MMPVIIQFRYTHTIKRVHIPYKAKGERGIVS